MRLVLCGLSAVLLSGCSWLGGFGSSGSSHYAYEGTAPQHHGAYHKRPQSYNPCVIYSPVQPVPAGCDPAKVTLANASGQYGGPAQGGAYTTGGYGSHAANVDNTYHQPNQRLKKPRLRGSLSLGVERSYSGELLNYDSAGNIIPGSVYDPDLWEESTASGSPATGNVTTLTYHTPVEQYLRPNISFDDVYTNPATISAGLEYIMSPKLTVFANAGYTHAEGNDGPAVTVVGSLTRTTESQDYDPVTLAPLGAPSVTSSAFPNTDVAFFNYDFNDMRRYNLEVGARKYFEPVIKNEGFRTVTPFVGVAVGASHVNEVTATVSQDQLYLENAFNTPNPALHQFYDALPPGNSYTLYESAWLPNGSLTAGMEWQLTPKTALALETGVKYEKSRDYVNGVSGDRNISVPVTLRGSFNF